MSRIDRRTFFAGTAALGGAVLALAQRTDAAEPALPAGDSFLQSGLGAVARSRTSKLGEWVSVKDFGAVGNGVADDTAAIQAAINYVASLGGGVVYFPSGTYLVSAAVTITSNGLALVGCGLTVVGFASIIKNINATAMAFNVTASLGARFAYMSIGH